MTHVCPSVPMGDDVRVYCEPIGDGVEVGVDTSAGRRLRTVFEGRGCKSRARQHGEWLAQIIEHYCRVNSVTMDFSGCA